MKGLDNKTALITGASSGIGACFASQLADQGFNLILVGRRQDRLVNLADEIQARTPIKVEVLTADLTASTGIARVEKCLLEQEDLKLLINNAGFGTWDYFFESEPGKPLAMIQLHVVAPVRLCHAALPGMLARGTGSIINVASIGAFLPAPRNVIYNATKAFLVSFSQSLQAELKGSGIRVQVLCPGFTSTQFHDSGEYSSFSRSQVPGWLWSSPEQVVTSSLKALGKKKVVFIPGVKNRALVTLARSSLTAPLFRLAARSVEQQSGLNLN